MAACHRVVGPLASSLAALAALLIGAGLLYLRRHEESLADQAERAMHGRIGMSAGSEPAPLLGSKEIES